MFAIYLYFFFFSEEYERHKYIQIHNKFESVRLEAVKNGRVVPMNREISKMCKYNNSYQNMAMWPRD